jgi:hypothetical protein
MSSSVHPEMGRDDIEMLLPWFVTGTLEPDERKQVEAYLAKHPDMRKQLDLIEAERSDTVMNNEGVGVPPAEALAKLMGAIDGQSLARRSGFAALSGWVQSGLDWLGTRQALVPAAAVAAVAIILQAGVIGSLLLNHQVAGVVQKPAHTASAPPPPATYAQVKFVPTASIHDIEQALKPLGISIADGPKAGLYRVKLADKVLGEVERDLMIANLVANKNVIQLAIPGGQ